MVKPIKEHLLYTDTEMPVRVVWRKGRRFKKPILAYHDEIEFQFIKQGRGSYLIAGCKYFFKTNSLLIVHPREIHLFIPDERIVTEKATLQFLEKPFLDAAASRIIRSWPRRMALQEKEAASVELLLDRIIEEQNNRVPGWNEMISLKLKEFLLIAGRAAARAAASRLIQDNPVAVGLLDYIEKNFMRPISISNLRPVFGFSGSYLCKLFKRQTGLGVKQYVLQRRIMEAKQLLESNPSLKVKAVADETGFADFSSFNRMFWKRVGMTPACYRRLIQTRRAVELP